MPAINFPDTPNVNDTFSSAGITWIWTGVVWKIVPPVIVEGHEILDEAGSPLAQEAQLQFVRLNTTAGAGKTVVTRPADTFVGTTAPPNPVPGDIWKNTETWKTYTWFDNFWVEDMSNGQGGSANIPPNATFDGMGATVLVGSQSLFRAASSGIIKGWSIVARGTNPTCTFDIWKIGTGTALPTVANTIMGTKPALVTGNAIYSTTMTGWTLSYNSGDIFIINVDACANALYIQFLLYI